VAEQWAAFATLILEPIDAPRLQRIEMRRAFYAGFHAALIVEFAIAELSDDAGVAVLNGLHDECKAFAREIAEGRA
jgi:hypothetical protein